MNYTKAQMFRVRAYDSDRKMTHSFRVAAESVDQAETKVANYVKTHKTNVIARPAGFEEFWQ